MKISKLSAMTRDHASELRRFQAQNGRNWKEKLLDMYATGKDANSPLLRQIRNSQLKLVRQLTQADFQAPILARYGTIELGEEEKPFLKSFGVEIADYDHRSQHFVVRVSGAAYNDLRATASSWARRSAWGSGQS